MARFHVIGTAHVEHPGLFRALEAALDQVAPDQLILEMPDEATTTGEVTGQKPEMVVSYHWARRRGVPVRGHEPPGLSALRDGLTPEALGSLAQEMDALISKLTVRRTIDVFCKRDAPRTVAERRLSTIIDTLVDPDKALARTRGIVGGIKRIAAPEGDVLILCGAAHVPHIAEALEDCRVVSGEHFY
ncbi:hypothetical protein [Phenylobacterium sp.]|uniref:hypothetical protein n=1 Tax=Phenylobacterium sp. TaxID=1871053 RepID=UPI0030F3705E